MCTEKHHRILHPRPEYTRSQNIPTQTQESTNTHQFSTYADIITDFSSRRIGICPTQKVVVVNEAGHQTKITALIDSGADYCILSSSIAQKMGLCGDIKELTIHLAGGTTRRESSEEVEFKLVSLDGLIPIKAFAIPKPCNGARSVSRSLVKEDPILQHLEGELNLDGGQIDLVIGSSVAEAFIDTHVLRGNNGLTAKKNCLGWYLIGNMQYDIVTAGISAIQIHQQVVFTEENVLTDRHSLESDLKRLLTQDQVGVQPTTLCTCTDSELREKKFIDRMNTQTKLVDGRLQVRMPWKNEPPTEGNYKLALARLHSSEKSFIKRGCTGQVSQCVSDLQEMEFVKIVPADQIDHNLPEWYLPIQAVLTPSKSTKCRLVFDASAKGQNGRCLNDYLEKGPNYLNQITDVLLLWRWDSIGYAGDIRKMFNQILLHPDDRKFHRFLWRTPTDEPPIVFEWQRLNFGDKPAPDLALSCIRLLASNARARYPDVSKELIHNSYMDDIGGSKSTVDDVKTTLQAIDSILSDAKFEIKSWHSNSPDIDQSDDPVTEFLGHVWHKTSDKISLKQKLGYKIPNPVTKRICLTVVAQMWDPNGLVLPCSIKYRIGLQSLWSRGLEWDETLPMELQEEWGSYFREMVHLRDIKIPRSTRPLNSIGNPEIHGFSDGGERAYGAVIFIRWKCIDDTYSTTPILAKAFVTPLKIKSIPRIELMGLLVLARLYTAVMSTLKFLDENQCLAWFWVDNTTVIKWIKQPPATFRPFVSVRVAEIQDHLDIRQVHYVDSTQNIADALTRGITPEKLAEWSAGPQFLRLPNTKWNFSEPPNPSSIDCKTELRVQVQVHVSKTDSEVQLKTPILQHLVTRLSTYSKIRKVLGLVLRFISNLKAKRSKSKPNYNILSVEELRTSTNLLTIWAQQHLEKIPEGFHAQRDESGILRAHGRLENIRRLPANVRNPILLPGDHRYTELLLLHLHRKRFHCGYHSLVYESRRSYWITKDRYIAKKLVRRCITCRKLRKQPLQQQMGQLPELRTGHQRKAFQNCAIDMFGPVHIKLARRTLKEAQVIIFTCMTSRAIHLELVSDKSTDTFLMALRRFASTRGHPQQIWSDQGSNFIGAETVLNDLFSSYNKSRIQEFLRDEFSCDFKWQWNIPTASHQNGVVESLIRSVRVAMNASCKERPYTEEQWRTILAEITYVVNSRPLYPASYDIFAEPPITPNDLIIGPNSAVPQPDSPDRVDCRAENQSVQKRVQEFWTSWMKYFAPTLLPRNKWYHPRDNVSVGDIVLVVDAKQKRCKWQLARVTEIYTSPNDKLVRKVQIRTQTGYYDRPVHKLCLIATAAELKGDNLEN
jgi:hypothetical protein